MLFLSPCLSKIQKYILKWIVCHFRTQSKEQLVTIYKYFGISLCPWKSCIRLWATQRANTMVSISCYRQRFSCSVMLAAGFKVLSHASSTPYLIFNSFHIYVHPGKPDLFETLSNRVIVHLHTFSLSLSLSLSLSVSLSLSPPPSATNKILQDCKGSYFNRHVLWQQLLNSISST